MSEKWLGNFLIHFNETPLLGNPLWTVDCGVQRPNNFFFFNHFIEGLQGKVEGQEDREIRCPRPGRNLSGLTVVERDRIIFNQTFLN